MVVDSGEESDDNMADLDEQKLVRRHKILIYMYVVRYMYFYILMNFRLQFYP